MTLRRIIYTFLQPAGELLFLDMYCEDTFKIPSLLPLHFDVSENLVKLDCYSSWKAWFWTKSALRLRESFLKHAHMKTVGERTGGWKLTGEMSSYFTFWFSGMCLVPVPRGAVWLAVGKVNHLTSYVPNVVSEAVRAALTIQPFLSTTYKAFVLYRVNSHNCLPHCLRLKVSFP